VFCDEIYSCNFQPAQYLKNKIDKNNFLKKHNKKNHMGNDCSNPQCFKEKKYKAKFSTNLILKT
jgi:hypothetical protein